MQRVIVIGAGMAGLAAARMLRDSGFLVTVLEGRNRIGGRTWTDDSLGAPCDLGASWIHHADANPLTRWCQAIGVDLVYAPVGQRRFYENGDFARLTPLIRRAWRGMVRASLRIASATLQSRMQVLLGRTRQTSVAQVAQPLIDNEHLPLFDRQLLAWMVSASEGVQGAPAEEIDLRNWYPSESNSINALPAGGYRRLVQDVASGLDVRLNTSAVAVVRHDTGMVVQTASDAFMADAVVVAVPLSILKQGKIRFEPALEQRKQAAIAAIGFGGDAVLNKLHLRFERRFWPDTLERCITLPVNPQQRGRFTNWINAEPIYRAPILLTFCTGRAAAELDRTASDEDVLAEALTALARLLNQPIPQPVAFHFTRWLSDPWAMGSYSYSSIHSSDADRLAYAQPVGDRLYFAGEATRVEDYGTVNAALLSGEQAACDLVRRFTHQTPDVTHLPYR